MIFTIEELLSSYPTYQNKYEKIANEIKAHTFFKIKRGLYTNKKNENEFLIANALLTPSYISFETALAYYGLIPEEVRNITSASYDIRKQKIYSYNNKIYKYNDIPKEAFVVGYILINIKEDEVIKIATKEKAICDKLYQLKTINSIKGIKHLLFDNLRLDSDTFNNLDFNKMINFASLYKKSVTLNTFVKYLQGVKNERNN